jgi:hypothetical protein
MLTDMVVYSQYIMRATIETVSQKIDLFNAASRGAIALSSEGFEGDFLKRSMFGSLAAAQRRVDRYATNDTQTATVLAEIEDKIVKVAGGFGPVSYTPSQLTWLQRNEAEAITAISGALADAIIRDQLNAGIASAVAALGNVAALTLDISATLGISHSALNQSHALFGDRSTALVAEVMNGASYHKLVAENIANASRLFTSGDVTVVDILNKIVVVTDAPALYATGTPNKNYILSLAVGGITISDSSDLVTNLSTTNGKKIIETTFQADYAFGIGIKGFAWDETSGGKSPIDSELATGTNWDMYVSSIKDTAGVVLIVDATK